MTVKDKEITDKMTESLMKKMKVHNSVASAVIVFPAVLIKLLIQDLNGSIPALFLQAIRGKFVFRRSQGSLFIPR